MYNLCIMWHVKICDSSRTAALRCLLLRSQLRTLINQFCCLVVYCDLISWMGCAGLRLVWFLCCIALRCCFFTGGFLRATAGTAIARLSHRNSVRLSVRPSVRRTGGSGKNGAS